MSIIEHARSELAAVNFEEKDREILVDLMQQFFNQWDSGGAVGVVMPVLTRLMEGKPITPLTGKPDEWVVHDFDDELYAQNKRCGSVFMRKDRSAYDIVSGRRAPITFPYYPPTGSSELRDAERYRWLRNRSPDGSKGGIFIGLVPQNVVVTGDDADREIDAAIAAESVI